MAALEAVTMANLAQTLGVRAEQLVIEPTARKTWQNVGCLHSRLLKVERVFVVSDSLHAQRAVRYACRQDARLCGRVVNAGVVPPIDQLWWSLPAAAWQGAAFLRDRLQFERNARANGPPCGHRPAPPDLLVRKYHFLMSRLMPPPLAQSCKRLTSIRLAFSE